MLRKLATDSAKQGEEAMAEMMPATLEALDILGLMKLLPHRYPFLLIDQIIDIDGDNSAIGIKNVTFNEPHFQGHFPASRSCRACSSSRRWRRRPARSAPQACRHATSRRWSIS